MKLKFNQLFKSLNLGLIFLAPLTTISANCLNETNNLTSSSKLNSFFHKEYQSLEDKYRKQYYLDINREEINLQNQIKAAFHNTKLTGVERFNNVYYHDDTYVDVFHLDTNNTNDPYLEKSVNTEWQSQNGFAHIADDESGTVDTHVNSWLQVCAYNWDLAAYFVGSTDEAKITYPCTTSAIKNFVKNNISKNNNKLDFSGLLINDKDRDNSVLSLLNPMLLKCLIAPSLTDPNLQIKSIDLSSNNLRIVPNWASIANTMIIKNNVNPSQEEANANWFFNDVNLVGSGHKMNDETEKDVPSDINAGGYFDEINLEHNFLTYVNLRGYKALMKPTVEPDKWSPTTQSPKYEVYENEGDQKGYMVSADLIKSTNPGLPTLVKFGYENNKYFLGLEAVQRRFNGVMIDCNFMPRLMWHPLKTNRQYVWWYEQNLTYKTAASVGSFLIPTIASSMLGYVNYTLANATDSAIHLVENSALRWGVYNFDQTIIDNNDLSNYVALKMPLLKDTLPSAVWNKNWFEFIQEVKNYFILSQSISIPLDSLFFDPSNKLALLAGKTWLQYSRKQYRLINDSFGYIQMGLIWNVHINRYLPESIHLEDLQDLNKLVTELTKYFSLNLYNTVRISGLKENYLNQKILGITFGAVGVVLLSWFGFLIFKNTKHALDLKRSALKKAGK